MTSIDAWLQRQARREQRLITLEDALLGNRARSYAVYRLRYFSLRCLSAALLHGIRLTLLRFIFPHQTFLATLVLHAVVSLVTSFWWGGLEVLRARVRHLSRDAQPRRIPGEIGQWLALAAGLAFLSLLLPTGWIAWQLMQHQRFDVLHFYVLALCVRLAADLMVLTFHSGVYAIRRVYRPLPAMVAVELAGFLALLLLWPWLGRWSFPVAVLCSTVVSTGLIVHYTARLYRLLGWLPLQLSRPQWAALMRRKTVAEFFSAGTSYALMKMDAFLMLAMFDSRHPAANGVTLFMLFVSIGPAVQAGFDWAQLLYFDLKRLDARCLQSLRQRYERLAFHLAWAVALALWGLACVLGTTITRQNLGALYWFIGPFFLSRSLLALAQIQAFSKRRYGVLLASGGLLLAAMLGLQVSIPGEPAKLLGLAGVCVLVAWIVRASTRRSTEDTSERRVLPLNEWLHRLQEVREPVRVCALRFRDEARLHLAATGNVRVWAQTDHWRHQRMAQRIAGRIRRAGGVTLLDAGHVAWYEVARLPGSISEPVLLGWGGGLLRSVSSSRYEVDGVRALRAALQMRLLRGPLRHAPHRHTRPRSLEEVKALFAAWFPHGVVYSPNDTTPAPLVGVSSRERRRIFSEGVHFAQHLQSSPRPARFDVTSYCGDGELQLIFVIDRRHDRRRRTRWRTLLTEMNLAAALVSAPSEVTGERRPHTAGQPHDGPPLPTVRSHPQATPR